MTEHQTAASLDVSFALEWYPRPQAIALPLCHCLRYSVFPFFSIWIIMKNQTSSPYVQHEPPNKYDESWAASDPFRPQPQWIYCPTFPMHQLSRHGFRWHLPRPLSPAFAFLCHSESTVILALHDMGWLSMTRRTPKPVYVFSCFFPHNLCFLMFSWGLSNSNQASTLSITASISLDGFCVQNLWRLALKIADDQDWTRFEGWNMVKPIGAVESSYVFYCFLKSNSLFTPSSPCL